MWPCIGGTSARALTAHELAEGIIPEKSYTYPTNFIGSSCPAASQIRTSVSAIFVDAAQALAVMEPKWTALQVRMPLAQLSSCACIDPSRLHQPPA